MEYRTRPQRTNEPRVHDLVLRADTGKWIIHTPDRALDRLTSGQWIEVVKFRADLSIKDLTHETCSRHNESVDLQAR